MRTLLSLFLLCCAWLVPVHTTAQEPERADSLELEIRTLKAQLDSLQRVLERLIREGQDTAQVSDELAALRAAAQEAAADAAVSADTTTPQESRTRNLSLLNPEISVTGDVVGYYTMPAEGRNRAGAVPREFEFSFQAPLDPYTRTKIFAAYHEDVPIAGLPEVGHGPEGEGEEGEEGHNEEHGHGGFEIEEAYVYWVGLPGAFGLKAGKFRQEIGLYNRWHTHALWEVDRPLPLTVFLGEDGLIQTGASLTFPSVTLGPSTQTFTVEGTSASNQTLFGEAADLSVLGRFQSFWDLSSAAYLQFGATGVYGENRDAGLKSRLAGIDVAFRWAPPNRSLYQTFHLKGEWYYGKKDIGGQTEVGKGGYLQLNYRASRRLIFGARGDYMYDFDDLPDTYQVVPSITWWQSEWLYLRVQYNYVKPKPEGGNHTVLLQVVWAIGPHKHENY
ncbi:MAG: hypothetical protein JSW71_22480 [Gemmatimonadota bacterium]|nr:MAG: hypothetical protein JSW71_22480 [Gemmatimonadota bacterium]